MTCLEPHLDGCPACVFNTEIPYAHATHPTYCVTAHRCADCGHEWSTTWRSA